VNLLGSLRLLSYISLSSRTDVRDPRRKISREPCPEPDEVLELTHSIFFISNLIREFSPNSPLLLHAGMTSLLSCHTRIRLPGIPIRRVRVDSSSVYVSWLIAVDSPFLSISSTLYESGSSTKFMMSKA